MKGSLTRATPNWCPLARPVRHDERAAAQQENPAIQPSAADPDFDLPVRAFAKRYVRSLSGPRKYAVLVARLAGGKVGQTILQTRSRKAVGVDDRAHGRRLQPAYAARAKNEGWVDAIDRDTIVLRKDWINALGGN